MTHTYTVNIRSIGLYQDLKMTMMTVELGKL